jgi:5'-3' exonuclease
MKKNPTILIIDGNLLARKSFYKFKNLSIKVKNEDLISISRKLIKKTKEDTEDKSLFVSENSGREVSIQNLAKIDKKLREISSLQDSTIIYTGVLYGMLRSILVAYNKFNINKVVIAYDPPYINSTTKIRGKLTQDYKDRKRDTKTEALFYSSLSLAQSFFYKVGIEQSTTTKFEADDLLHYYTHNLYKDNNCLVLTNDHDLFQILVPNRVKILKIGKDYSIYSSTDFKSEFNISPKQYLQVLTLGGCSTDNVKGVPGLSSDTALKLIQEFKSIKSLLKLYKSSSLPDRIKNILNKEIESDLSNLKLSLKLVSLYGLHPSLISDIISSKTNKSPEIRISSSISILNLLNFKSFLTESGINSLKSLILSQEV